MTLFIGDHLIQKPDNFSDRVRLALGFVDGGVDWVHWAMTTKTTPYAFADEDSLLDSLQQGLHGTRLTLLPKLGLMVSPVKLSSMDVTELFALQGAEGPQSGDPKVAARAQRVLDRYGLHTNRDLALVDGFLDQLGVRAAPVFQALGFTDRLSLYHLMTRIDPDATPPTLTDLDKEAAAFGVQEARAPQEFIDYFQIYKDMAAKPNIGADTPEKRAQNAAQAVRNLQGLMFNTLGCPQVPGLVSPDEVAQAVKLWAVGGKAVGFARLSAGVREIVAHTVYQGQAGQAALTCLSVYRNSAREMLENADFGRGILGQDGATCLFPVASAAHEGWLKLDPDGVISLTSFKLKSPPPLPGDPFQVPDETQMEKAS